MTISPQFTIPWALRPRQNGRHFADNIFKRIFVNENVRISIKISLKFVPKGPVNNILALVQIMAWRHPGDKPLSERVMVSLLTHICVTRPQWVNHQKYSCYSQHLYIRSGYGFIHVIIIQVAYFHVADIAQSAPLSRISPFLVVNERSDREKHQVHSLFQVKSKIFITTKW